MIAVIFTFVYIVIGFCLAKFDARAYGEFEAPTILLWAFGLDIRVRSWFEIRRIERESARRLAEALVERERTLRVIVFRWIDEHEAAVTIEHRGALSTWRGNGSCTTWRSVSNEDHASEWLSVWLCDQWELERRRRDETLHAG